MSGSPLGKSPLVPLMSEVKGEGPDRFNMVVFSWQHCSNETAYLSFVADHVHHYVAAVYQFSDDYFEHDNARFHKSQIISNWLK